MAVGYPSHREADVALRDGSTVHIRPIRREDEAALLAFLKHLSLESRYLRFMSAGMNLERVAAWAVEVDYHDRTGLVATIGGRGIIAHAMYARTGPDRAEVALAIADAMQGRGIGTILLGHLTEAAQDQGISTFEARVLPQNHKMIDMFRQSGFPVRMRSEPGEIAVEFPASLSEDAVERFEDRERLASVAAIEGFLRPGSVAVVGASTDRGTIGGELFHHLMEGGFNGPVYPVSREDRVVQSVQAFPSVLDVPGPVDLALVAIPAVDVLAVAGDCAAKGVRAMVVLSSGFAEVGPTGLSLQRELLALCRSSGMRLIGPNCVGIVNTADDVRLHATLGPIRPLKGPIGFLSQSGALGLAVIDRAASSGLGLSSFVSVGNKADISGNDLISYWDTDPDTSVILLYLESFGNPRKFARISRRVGRTKPIVAVKSGQSAAGARATTSHTGALLAASDVTIDALFLHSGVIRTETLSELLDVAALLTHQPLPAGDRVVIVTNSGGLGVMCADACEAGGLQVPPLPETVRNRLAALLSPQASLANPVDLLAAASAEEYGRAIEALASAGAADAIIVIHVPPLAGGTDAVARAIREAAASAGPALPLLTVFPAARREPDQLHDERVRLPTYVFPEDAARALSKAVRYAEWRARPEEPAPSPSDLRRDEAAAVLAAALDRGPGWLAPDEVATLLSCYGLPMAEWRPAASPDDAGRAAAELGGMVALKAILPGQVHRADRRGIRLSLSGSAEVTAAAEAMHAELSRAGYDHPGFVIQRMVTGGVEMLVGMVHDSVFGPVLACGASGAAVELTKDVAVRLTPVTGADAAEMVRSLATFQLLDGYRGTPRADVSALEDVLVRVSALVEAHPEIEELDLNPVMVLPRGCQVVDARIRVHAQEPRAPLSARRA